MSRNRVARSLRRLDVVYATLPTLVCAGKCQGSCGPILMSRLEWERIIQRVGHTPKGDDSLICPMLDRASGKCRVYEVRPLICRLWGLVEALACPWGCRPSRWLTDREARRLLDEVEKVSRNSEGNQ